jgi:hypothetical protein
MFGSVFCRFSANLDPQDPSRSPGLTLQFNLHEKTAPQTKSKAISWRTKKRRLSSGTQQNTAVLSQAAALKLSSDEHHAGQPHDTMSSRPPPRDPILQPSMTILRLSVLPAVHPQFYLNFSFFDPVIGNCHEVVWKLITGANFG